MFPQTHGAFLTVGSTSTMCCEVAGSTRLAQIQRASLDRLQLQVTAYFVKVTLAVWCGSHLLRPCCCLSLVSGVTSSSHSLVSRKSVGFACSVTNFFFFFFFSDFSSNIFFCGLFSIFFLLESRTNKKCFFFRVFLILI